ncbi:PREDICTED: uncharacterized protein LOC109343448 isoform X2 [Lupinus angustifolius]|uniref:uncharacterized protein LOC109343448 isoform X2 n=1 Tax=Lupinus angustifolius TaxID=3871 RepID=UPI00092F55A8|nr:PREDICTED: uncharacterized protein LOC109343448 isoform X2 [Lupinus angustifolius]
MASSLGSNCVNAKHGTFHKRCGITIATQCSVAINDYSRSTVRKGRIYAAGTATKATAARLIDNRKSYGSGGANDVVGAQERLDEWMRNSVVEIVKNLKEAPLLVQVYTKNKNGEGETSVSTEKKVVVEDWTKVKERWEAGETPLPEGVIFVEEIGSDEKPEDGGAGDRMERTTRVWGVVVQGRGVGCKPVCYLLKTCRVGSGIGSGLYSTHFCLVRVKSLRETAQSQLKNCWLLQSQLQ